MAHEVLFKYPNGRILGNSDIVFEIKDDNELLGRLKISRGSLIWEEKGKKLEHEISWKQFSNYMKKRPLAKVKSNP